MFTGLKATNHFGRPDMTAFLKFIQKQHSYVSRIDSFDTLMTHESICFLTNRWAKSACSVAGHRPWRRRSARRVKRWTSSENYLTMSTSSRTFKNTKRSNQCTCVCRTILLPKLSTSTWTLCQAQFWKTERSNRPIWTFFERRDQKGDQLNQSIAIEQLQLDHLI